MLPWGLILAPGTFDSAGFKKLLGEMIMVIVKVIWVETKPWNASCSLHVIVGKWTVGYPVVGQAFATLPVGGRLAAISKGLCERERG